jgi:TonB family protein
MTLTTHGLTTRRAVSALAFALALALTLSTGATARAAYTQDAQAASDADGFERGKRLLTQGDAAGAAAEFKRAAEARKTDADAWYLLGVALSRSGNNGDARKAFEKSLKLRPSDADAHTGLAYALLTLGKLRDAEREAQSALAINPQIAEAHYVVGVVRYRENKFKEAEEEAEAALNIKPTLGAAAYLAGDSLMALYFDESDRQAMLHPTAPAAGDDARRAAAAMRAPALEPIRARMREIASSLETIVNAQPNNPEAELWREQAGSMQFYGRAEDENSGIYRVSEVEVRATILSKSEPGFTEEARRNNISGTVRLRAVLAADGRVRNIAVVRSLSDGLTELAIRAARRIRFTPAFKDGHAVSQYVTIEYNFNVY